MGVPPRGDAAQRKVAFVEEHARAAAAAGAAEQARLDAMPPEERAAHEASVAAETLHAKRKAKMLAQTMKGSATSARAKLLGKKGRKGRAQRGGAAAPEPSPEEEREGVSTVRGCL